MSHQRLVLSLALLAAATALLFALAREPGSARRDVLMPEAPRVVVDQRRPDSLTELTELAPVEESSTWQANVAPLPAPATGAGATLVLTVRDARGKALSDAAVELTSEDGRSAANVRPVASGERRFSALEPGRWTIQARAAGKRDAGGSAELTPGEERRVELTLEDARTIEVSAFTVDGRPFPDAANATAGPFAAQELYVVATRARPDALLPGLDDEHRRQYGMGRWHPRTRGEDGVLGSVEVRRERPQWLSLCWRELVLETQELADEQRQATFQVSPEILAARLGTVRIRVLDDFTGEAPPGGAALLESATAANAGDSEFELPPLAGDGRVVWRDLAPGWYVVRVFAPDSEIVQRAVRVEPGAEVDLGDVRLGEALALTGTVRDESGAPLRSTFFVRDAAWEARDAPLVGMPLGGSGNDGRIRFGGLGRARYDVLVRAPGHAPRTITVDTRSGPPPTLEITLERGATLVLEARWNASELHRVSVHDSAGRVAFVETMGGGTKRRLTLARGAHEVRVHHAARELFRAPLELTADGLAVALEPRNDPEPNER